MGSPLYTLRLLLTSSTSSNGQGHEGKVCEQDCKGPHGQSLGVSWIQGEDSGWHDCILFDEEQERQGREQEAIRDGQEELLDDCCSEGKEGTEGHRLRRNQEGLRALQEGQGVLLKMLVMASQLGAWGCLRPLSAVSFDSIEVVEHC